MTPVPIPQPSTVPLLGNAHLIDKDVPLSSLLNLAKEYGPIYQLSFPGPRTSIIVSNLELVNQFCDQKRFQKWIGSTLKEVRNLTGDGLFTAHDGESAWGIAHRVLMPAFGPVKIRDMFPGMIDIASQLLAKWERFGPSYAINSFEDFTRLTFDTIAFCAMSYRLNSFYSHDLVPFLRSMGSFLHECDARSRRPALIQTYLSRGANAKFEADMATMMDLTKEIIKTRKESKDDIDDLLGLMLQAKDPVTGQGMTDESIAQNLVTFMIAGHETTSGLLSFTVCHILDHPHVYARVRAEVDQVLGEEPIRPDHLNKFPYLTAVLRETLRYTPPIPAITVGSRTDQIVTNEGVEYLIPKEAPVQVIIPQLHRDTKAWGEDVDDFRPERMLDGGFENAPANAWKPWGNGVRSCIGRPFAWQEAIICLACILQKFDLVHNDPSYKLSLRQTLTVKPREFFFRAIPRKRGPTFSTLVSPVSTTPSSSLPPSRQSSLAVNNGVPIYLAYGSNSGTCKDFAQRVAGEAPVKGFAPHIVTLDSIEASVPTDGPVIVLTASYEGEPADTARRFVETLRLAQPGQFANVRFAVFGCGHHDWAQTYQKIPRFIDQVLGDSGGQRLIDREEADSGADTFFDTFDNWVPKLWATLGNAYGDRVTADGVVRETLSIEMISDTRPATLKRDEASHVGTVISNRLLTPPGVPAKHHIEIELPEGMTYTAGDYVSILPRNPVESITRVLSRFRLLPDQNILIKSKASTALPTGKPVSVWDVLAGYVEIGQTATRKNILDLMKFAPEETVNKLEALLDDYKGAVADKHFSVLDILEQYPEIDIPLATFLFLLPSMRIRQYSISSSPLWNDRHVTITISVVEISAGDGKPNKFMGVASNYLAKVRSGDLIYVGIRNSAGAFHLPADPSTRVVMFAAGSGIAPMRGFLQERALQAKSGRPVGKTVLFYGCRAPDMDFLYSEDDFKEWEQYGFLEIKPAFSRASDKSFGNKYVQDRVWYDRDLITEFYEANAKFFTCGSPSVANGLNDTIVRLIKFRQPTWDEDTIAQAWQRVLKDRLATDVFA